MTGEVGDVVGVELELRRRLDDLRVVGDDDDEDLHRQPADEEDHQDGHQQAEYLGK